MTPSPGRYALSEYSLGDLSDAELEPIIRLSNLIGQEREPRHSDVTVEEARILFDSPGQVRRRFVVRDGNQPVAMAVFQHADDDSNRNLLRVAITVAPDHRRKGIGTSLLARAAAAADELDRTLLSGEVFSTVPAGSAFANEVGGRSQMDFDTNVLDMADLDRQLMKGWVEEGSTRADGYTIRTFPGMFPDELLGGIAHLFMVLERDMPTPASWEERHYSAEEIREFLAHLLAAGETITAVAVHDATGEAAGLSQLYRRRAEPSTWQVITTMVDPKHRGHGLGKWVKGASNLMAQEIWGDARYQETSNAHTNEAMLAINRAMGFRHEYAMTNYEADLADVKSYLGRRGTGNIQ
jgi:GNAT superfamily N-acetyltransferase